MKCLVILCWHNIQKKKKKKTTYRSVNEAKNQSMLLFQHGLFRPQSDFCHVISSFEYGGLRDCTFGRDVSIGGVPEMLLLHA